MPASPLGTAAERPLGLPRPARSPRFAIVAGTSAVALVAGIGILAPGAQAASATFTATGSMAGARQYAGTAVAGNGKVLVAGGYNSAYLSSTSLFDPVAGSFSPGPGLSVAHYGATATTLNNGRVLVTGGYTGSEFTLASQIYDPVGNTFTSAFLAAVPMSSAVAVKLNNGSVLIAGGEDYTSPSRGTTSAQIFNGVSFSTANSMHERRQQPTANLLANGSVLIAGGTDPVGGANATAEIYSGGVFNYTTGNMSSPRYAATSSALPDGRILIAGGRNSSGYLNSTEIYNPDTGTFISGPSMATQRGDAVASVLSDGKILIAGGLNNSSVLASSEIYDPATGLFGPGPSMTVPRMAPMIAPVSGGKVLIAGGFNSSSNYLSTAELFNPATVDPPAPGPAAQVPVNCSALPSKIKPNGNTVLMKKNCFTSAGLRMQLKAKPKGSHARRPFTLIRKSSGKVTIRTYGVKLKKVTVTRHSPATPSFLEYKLVKTIKVK